MKTLLFIFFLSSTAFATTMSVPPGASDSQEWVMANSALVVTGTVTKTESFEAANGFFFTRVTLKIKTVVKGNARGEIQFVVPGGCIDGNCLVSDMFPTYQVGETRTVYLKVGPDGLILTTLGES